MDPGLLTEQKVPASGRHLEKNQPYLAWFKVTFCSADMFPGLFGGVGCQCRCFNFKKHIET